MKRRLQVKQLLLSEEQKHQTRVQRIKSIKSFIEADKLSLRRTD